MEELILFLVFGVIMIVVASAKGFNPMRWFFAAGLLGLIILFFLPSAAAKDIDENEKLKRITLGNKVGTVISVIALILAAILIIAGLIVSDDPEEILPVLLLIFSIFGTTAIGVFIFLKVKKIKLEKSAIAGGIQKFIGMFKKTRRITRTEGVERKGV
jgi:O-antigen/teichoic acid export membrane protein